MSGGKSIEISLLIAMKLGDRTGPEMQITVSDQLHN